MINGQELRLGNYVLYKNLGKINMVRCGWAHFEKLAAGDAKDLYPVALKAELLQRCSFIENKDYPLLPQAHEFRLVLPVMGGNKNEITCWIKSNGECFGRAIVNDLPVSQNFHHLHTLQNLYYGLVGEELSIKA
ncbi:MAG: hypothetical protein JWP88_1832 [Flaviaesturariibacter sp.]|nr:hypothetical protein [Flaviaesturariibacter sp.]